MAITSAENHLLLLNLICVGSWNKYFEIFHVLCVWLSEGHLISANPAKYPKLCAPCAFSWSFRLWITLRQVSESAKGVLHQPNKFPFKCFCHKKRHGNFFWVPAKPNFRVKSRNLGVSSPHDWWPKTAPYLFLWHYRGYERKLLGWWRVSFEYWEIL